MAGFVGVSNLLELPVAKSEGDVLTLQLGPEDVVTAEGAAAEGATAVVTIRPERIALGSAPGDGCHARGTVKESLYAGPTSRFVVELDGGGELMVVRQNATTSLRGGHGAAGAAGGPQLGAGVHPRHCDQRRGGLMRRLIGLVAMLAACAAIAACGSDNKKSNAVSTAKAPDVAQKGEGALNMVIWEGYADKSFANDFTKQTGCKVNAVPAGTSDEMFTKFRSGGGGQYDLVTPSGDASLRLIKSGAVAPLDTSKLTNYNDLAPQLQSPSFNTQQGKHYGLSFMWGANVLIYNKDKIKTPPTSWADLYSPKYKGKITVPDNPIQIADVALQFEGAQEPYAIDQATLDKVKAKLKAAAPARAQVLGAGHRLRGPVQVG